MSAFEVLGTLVSQAPAQIQPALQQVGRILQDLKGELAGHATDNVSSFNDVQTRLQQFADRIGTVESGITSINGTLVSISGRIDAAEAAMVSSSSLENAPTVIDIKSEITAVKVAVADIPAELAAVKQKIVEMNSADALNNAPTIVQLRKEISDLDIKMGPTGAVGSGVADPQGSVGLATAVATAVAQAISKPDGDSGWAGVAGSRIFTQRVKEYRGPMSEFSSWAKTFKSNIPKPMREACEWAEKEKDVISNDSISAHSQRTGLDTPKWNEEVWRCLSGVLKGNSETLMDTLAMGEGLELWRQLCAAHVLKTPEHADKLHQALNRIEPAKTLADVRHKINTIMAGVLKHDSMTDEPMHDGSKRTLIMRILPKEVAMHLALQPRTKNTAELVEKISSYLTDMGSFEVSQSNAPMELGELNLDLGTDSPENRALAKVQTQLEQLGSKFAAFVNGAPPPGIGAVNSGGAWNRYNGGGPGKGQSGGFLAKGQEKGKGVGKGKGKGKGPGPGAIANRRAQKNGSQALCPTEARKGKCDYEANTGKPCKFSHVKVPKELSGIEGLIRSDLGNLQWDEQEQRYCCCDELDPAQLDDFIASVHNEVIECTQELEQEWGF